MKDCTFAPNIGKARSPQNKLDTDEFYKRNLEWSKKVKSERAEKEEKIYHKLKVKISFKNLID